MGFNDINSVIASLAVGVGGATPAPVLIVKHDRAPPVKGRASLPVAIVVEVSDVVHHPGAVIARRSRDSVSTDETITAYFRQEVLTAVVDPGGNDAWWIVVGGIYYVVENTQPWTAGGFWVVNARRVRETSQMVRIAFGPLTFLQAAQSTPAIIALLRTEMQAYTPTRSFRFDFADAGEVVGVLWPDGVEQPDNVVAFRAVDENGNRVSVSPLSVVVVDGVRLTILPKIVSDAGRVQIEVI